MSAYEVADTVTEKIRSGEYDFVVINFANCDMVGHSAFLRRQSRPLRLLTPAWARFTTRLWTWTEL